MVALLAITATVSLLQVSLLSRPIPMDFAARYAGGQLVDHGVSPYDRAQQFTAQATLRPDLGELPFYDPPPTAALFRLVSLLPARTAAALWELLSAACLALSGWLLADLIGVRGWIGRLAIVSLLILFSPMRHAISYGQVEPVFLMPLFTAMWLCMRRSPDTWAVMCSSALAVASLCKPQLAHLPVAAVLIHCYRHDRLATVVGAATAASALMAAALLIAPAARWSDWLAALRYQPDSLNGSLRLVLAAGGIAGVALAVRAARSFRGSFVGWLLLAASSNGLAAAAVRWNPQWHAVLAPPVLVLLGLFVVRGVNTWSRQDQLVAALVGALSMPDSMGTITLHIDMIHAAIPLTMAAVILGTVVFAHLLPAWWAALTWSMTTALIIPPLDAHIAQVKGLLLCLAVLWLLPRIVGPPGRRWQLSTSDEHRSWQCRAAAQSWAPNGLLVGGCSRGF